MKISYVFCCLILVGACTRIEDPDVIEITEVIIPEPLEEIPILDSALVSEEGLKLNQLLMPSGFNISVFARVRNARSMALAEDGTLFIGNKDYPELYAVRDINGDFKADEKYVLAVLEKPNGVSYRDGTLYVTDAERLLKFENVLDNLNEPSAPIVIRTDLPDDFQHSNKYIDFGPDGELYIPFGSPCDNCLPEKELHATITKIGTDNDDFEIIASGVRNTVGFDWHPVTKELWFTDNGANGLGNQSPPCEINRLETVTSHFGFPICHAGILNEDLAGDLTCNDFSGPAYPLVAHCAPLGMKFCRTGNFPISFQDKIFVAEHGSFKPWLNSGYRISMLTELDGSVFDYTSFISGWINESSDVWGRPVDLVFAADGSMLISDDMSGTIYRVWYDG